MIPDEAVDAAAVASYVRAGGGTPESWQREEGHYRREYLEDARVQLEAAAPYIRAQTADVIADGMEAWAGSSERAYVRGFAEAAWGKTRRG